MNRLTRRLRRKQPRRERNALRFGFEALESRALLAAGPYPGYSVTDQWLLYEDKLGDGLTPEDSLATGIRIQILEPNPSGGGFVYGGMINNTEAISRTTTCSDFVPPFVGEHPFQTSPGHHHRDSFEGCSTIQRVPQFIAPNGSFLDEDFTYEHFPEDPVDVWQTTEFATFSEVFNPDFDRKEVSEDPPTRPDGYHTCLTVFTEVERIPGTFGGEDTFIDHHRHRNCQSNVTTVYTIPVFHLPLISGRIFDDVNADGVQGFGENAGVAGVRVFQDTDGDGEWGNEPSGVSDAAGYYRFLARPDPDGSRILTVVPPEQDRYVDLSKGYAFTPRSGDNATFDFGLAYQVGAAGTVFHDLDGDGIRDQGEPPMPDITIFFDRNQNGTLEGSFRVQGESSDRIFTARHSFPGTFENLCAGFSKTTEPCGVSTANGSYVIEGFVTSNGISLEQGGVFGELLRALPPRPIEDYTITQGAIYQIVNRVDILNADIGVFTNVSLAGQVNWDHNADGVPEADPISGVWVGLDLFNNGSFDEEILTGPDGKYEFAKVTAGTHSIWVFPTTKEKSTFPQRGVFPSHVVTPQSGTNITNLNFAFATGAAFEQRELEQAEEDEELQQLKNDVLRAILKRIDDQNQDNYKQWLRLKNLVHDIIALNSDGSVARSVSLERLQLLANLVEVQKRIQDDEGWWDEGWDGITADLDRLKAGTMTAWDAFWDEVVGLYDDQAHRDSRILAFDSLARGMITNIEREFGFLVDDLERDWNNILWDATISTIEDLGKGETYKKLASDLLGFESLQKAFDPSFPVEQRIGHFLLGYVQALGTLQGGAAAGKHLLTKARMKLLASGFAQEVTTDPLLAKSLAARLSNKVDDAARGVKVSLRDLADGDEIPLEILDEVGWTPAQIKALREIAIDEGLVMQFRTTNPASANFIRRKQAVPKAMDIKAKTINDADVHLGFRREDQGLVGLRDPKDLIPPDQTDPCRRKIVDLCMEIEKRYRKHTNDWTKLMSEFKTEKYFIDSHGRIIDKASNLPIAGDIDPVAFLKDGQNVFGPEYDALVERLKISQAMIQHGAETNIVDDVIRAMQKACDDLAPDCIPRGSADWHRKVGEAEKLKRDVLGPNHFEGKEITIEVDATGRLRRRVVRELPDVGYNGVVGGSGEGEDAITPQDNSPIDKAQFVRILQQSDIDIRRDGLKTIDAILQTIQDRAEAQIALFIKKLQKLPGEVGIRPSEVHSLSPADFAALVHSEKNGLRIYAATATEGEAEGETLTIQQILDKIRAAVGEFGPHEYRGTLQPDGGFLIESLRARDLAFDVNGDGFATPLDVLKNVNRLNETGAVTFSLWVSTSDARSDLNSDGALTPIDVLQTINYLNGRAELLLSAEGEGAESLKASDSVPAALDPAAWSVGTSSTSRLAINSAVPATVRFPHQNDELIQSTATNQDADGRPSLSTNDERLRIIQSWDELFASWGVLEGLDDGTEWQRSNSDTV